MVVLALDLGSSSVRALAFTQTGTPIPETQSKIQHQPTYSSDGGVEYQPLELIETVCTVLSESLVHCRRLHLTLQALGMSAFWHSLVGVDAHGQPTTPLFSWADTRPRLVLDELQNRLSEREIHARTGCRLHESYLPAKLLWLSQHQPVRYQKTAFWMSAAEFVFFRLFGERVCSISMASGTGLFNHQTLGWDEALLNPLQVSVGQFSSLVSDDFFFTGTELRAEFSKMRDMLGQTRFYPGLGDGACSNLGSGCTNSSRLAINLGTSAAARLVLPFPQPLKMDPANPSQSSVLNSQPGESPWSLNLWQYRVDSRRMLRGGALSNAGNLLAWARTSLNLPEPVRLEQELASLTPDAHGLTCLPFWAGERSPGWSANATGTITGFRFSTTPVEIVRCLMETVALRLAWIVQLLQEVTPTPPEIVLSGGAAVESQVWAQMICDALGQPILRLDETEASARGAALWILERGGFIDLQNLPQTAGHQLVPNQVMYEVYQKALFRHQRLYQEWIHQA
ncbi:MAG: gluconokinase [Blastocatellia bacterium]|nr:gluconokinase [Blastocatellia bacterium]